MSFANSLKKVATGFNAGLRVFKRNLALKSTCKGANLDALKPNNISLFMQPSSLSGCKGKDEKFCIVFPQADAGLKKTIIEPNKNVKISFELPIRSSRDSLLDLPFYIDKVIKDPPAGEVISKRAAHITTIRKKKMKKHKYKKFHKKNKVLIAKKKLMKKMEKESMFQNSLKNILGELDNYSPEKYVTETLEKVKWKKPVTVVKGFLAPKWVVKQYLEEKEQKKNLWERINECSK